jgi:hypothetical protein
MAQLSPSSRQLKQLRARAGISIREVAHALGMEYGSSYQHYEDRFKRPFLPLDLVMKLIPILGKGGVQPAELYALAGLDASGEPPALPAIDAEDSDQSADGRIKIKEIDLRTVKSVADKTLQNVVLWHLPISFMRSYTTAPADQLRIVSVIGDSMEPLLIPGQRLLVDIEDRVLSPPGIFVLRDGNGFSIKRVQIIPRAEPARVKIQSENTKYEAYECSLEEADIQGRVIAQWRWL